MLPALAAGLACWTAPARYPKLIALAPPYAAILGTFVIHPVLVEARRSGTVCAAHFERKVMQIAVITFDGFNEIDSFVAAHILNRLRPKGWKAFITSPDDVVTSMNGVVVHAERRLDFVADADAVIIGSGVKSREIAEDAALLTQIRLDPKRQLVASQCSGTLLLAKLGLLEGRPACTDLNTKKWVIEAGVSVVDRPFHAEGNIATAGGCLASQYLATWIILRLGSREDVATALHRVTPIGQQAEYIARAMEAVEPYLQ